MAYKNKLKKMGQVGEEIINQLRDLKKNKHNTVEYRTDRNKFMNYCRNYNISYQDIGDMLGITKQAVHIAANKSDKKMPEKA